MTIAAAAAVGGLSSYAVEQASTPKLQYRPGTPSEVVERCRQAAISLAKLHASTLGADLARVDAASAGAMRLKGQLLSAPVEVGVVYSRQTGRETRQAVVECRVDRRGTAMLADLPQQTR